MTHVNSQESLIVNPRDFFRHTLGVHRPVTLSQGFASLHPGLIYAASRLA